MSWIECGKPVKSPPNYPARNCERKVGHFGKCWLITPFEILPSTTTNIARKGSR